MSEAATELSAQGDPGNAPIIVPEGVLPEGTGAPVVDPPTGTIPTPEITPTNTDAPYKQQLEAFPESIRPIAEAQFKAWDAQVSERFEKLHSTYKPWEDVVEHFEPDQVAQAIALAQALEDDPEKLYKALQEHYKFGQGQPTATVIPPANTGGDPAELDPDNPLAAEVAQLRQQLGVVANYLSSDNQSKQLADANRELDGIMAGLKEKHGPFDETYVYTLIANDVPPEIAVQKYKDAINGALTTSQTPAPTVVGDGGGQPAEPFDPSKLSETQTKKYVADLLAQSAAQGD